MFYCNECAEKNGYPITIGRSTGTCELCGRHANCNDMSSSKLSSLDINPPAPKKNQEIENIAWEYFQDRLGMRFKNDISVEKKKEITDMKDYKQYRDEATKIYEKREKKKQKAILNNKYPIIDVPASGKSEWWGGAFTLCFVYSKYKGNFVLRGYMKEVEEYLKKNYTHYFYNMSLWYRGFNRDIWGFWKKEIGIFEPNRRSKTKGKDKWKFQVRQYEYIYCNEEMKDTIEKTLYFKRLPKHWIPEFDNL